ncbi:MAG: RluA family pseudouridine synthase [Ruminococcaceae bacterium]|nr:RluA family pseudouridine synthase [Oscillospiraceae bacterium]
MEILYQDAHLLLAVKPVGMDSEQEFLQAVVTECGGEALAVHRLDKAVGGVMAVARTQKAAAALSRAIQEGAFCKEYRAVVAGVPDAAEGVWDDLLFFDNARRKAFVVKRERKGVRAARLSYRVAGTAVDGDRTLSLLAITLDTGRSHQIRVQCASRRLPLVGDGKYGGGDNRCTVALWAFRLTLPHPETGEPLTVTAPMPDAFPFGLF